MGYKFIVFKTATGEVTRFGETDIFDDIALQAGAGETSLENTGDFTDSYYYDGSTFQIRPDFDTNNSLTGADTWLANGTDEVTYGPNLPAGTKVVIYTESGAIAPIDDVVNDGTFRLATDFPDIYTVTLESFPYLNRELTLTAT